MNGTSDEEVDEATVKKIRGYIKSKQKENENDDD